MSEKEKTTITLDKDFRDYLAKKKIDGSFKRIEDYLKEVTNYEQRGSS